MRTAFITGTSSGVGFSTSLLLAKNNFKVFASVRSIGKGEGLLNAAKNLGVHNNIHLVELDVSKEKDVSTVVKDVISKAGKLDVLINNAGYTIVKPTELTSMSEFREIFDTNFFGTVAVAKEVIPHMRSNKSGHIINISSYGGLVGQPFNDAYCAAKFAVTGWNESLHSTLHPFGVNVSLVCPGAITTPFAGKATGTVNVDPTNPYIPLQQLYMDNLKKIFSSNASSGVKSSQTAEELAEFLLNVINSKEPKPLYVTSEYIGNVASKKYVDITGETMAKTTITRSFGSDIKL